MIAKAMSPNRIADASMSLASPSSWLPGRTSDLWVSLKQNADEIVRNGFRHERDFFFTLLIISTGIVVAGLFLEEAKLWFPEGKPRPDPITGVFCSSALVRWRKRLEVLGWILIVVGVIGEGAFEGATSVADGLLQDFGNILLTATQKQAGDAQTSAEVAAGAATVANREADVARRSSSIALSTAKNAGQETAQLTRANAELSRNITTTAAKLQAVEAKRAELEKSLENLAICNAPRVLTFWRMDNGKKTSLDALKPFAGRQAIIEAVPDSEARRAAGYVLEALKEAGWSVSGTIKDGLKDGVEVNPYLVTNFDQEQNKELSSQWQQESQAEEGANAVVDFLQSSNWQARRQYPLDTPEAIPPGGIRVRVGLYPAIPFIAPPADTEFAGRVKQLRQEMDAYRANFRKKREEEILKNATPEQAARFRAMEDEEEKKDQEREKRQVGPCQPLAPLYPF